MLQSPRQAAAAPVVDNENPGGFLHIPALDGIRGAAILLVLYDHLFWANSNTGSRIFDVLTEIRKSAYVGVNLFFALSGFLITGILLDTFDVPHYFKTFYARRSLRIFPLYYGSIFLLLLLTRPMHFIWSGWQYFLLTYTSNLAVWRTGTLYLSFFGVNHFWSLQVEEQFYLIWPLIVYRVRKAESLVRICLVGCAAILGIRIFLVLMSGHPGLTNPYLPYSPTFSCADNILYGCCLCALLRTHWRAIVTRFAPRVLTVCAAILIAVAAVDHGLDWIDDPNRAAHFFIPTFGFSLVGISCACIIAMTLKAGSRTQRFFQRPFLRFFGRYSYGIYVFHTSVAGGLQAPLRLFFNTHLHSKAASVFLAACITAGVTILLALLSYHLYEVQFLRLKRYFSYNRGAGEESKVAVAEAQ